MPSARSHLIPHPDFASNLHPQETGSSISKMLRLAANIYLGPNIQFSWTHGTISIGQSLSKCPSTLALPDSSLLLYSFPAIQLCQCPSLLTCPIPLFHSCAITEPCSAFLFQSGISCNFTPKPLSSFANPDLPSAAIPPAVPAFTLASAERPNSTELCGCVGHVDTVWHLQAHFTCEPKQVCPWDLNN